MGSLVAARRYVNILALGLKMLSEFRDDINQICAACNYEEITENIINEMNSYWGCDDEQFFENIGNLLRDIEHETSTKCKCVKVLEFCKWLDFKITYSKNENNCNGERQFFSLHRLIPFSSSCYAQVDALNTNWSETGIWVNPKFSIASPYVIREGEIVEKPIANRDIFQGLNGVLKNCSYFFWDNKHKVKNIIFSSDALWDKENTNFTIAFSPMSDSAELIQIDEQIIERNGRKCNGECVAPIQMADQLLERFKNDWKLAAEMNADIFFCPELLGTELSERNDGIYNETVWELSNERLKNGDTVPRLTVLPSYWSDHHNQATIVDYDGKIIDYQEKHIPFVDKRNNKIEALVELDEWTTVLIHIPGVHRIAIVICAEFLSDIKRLQSFICGSLGVTLVLVPSYSRGEQDFINALAICKGYGTTVVWGNCCGAASGDEKAIGGCGIAGTTDTIVFGKKCQCNYSCKDIEACIFRIDIPLYYELKKVEESEQKSYVTHEIRREIG